MSRRCKKIHQHNRSTTEQFSLNATLDSMLFPLNLPPLHSAVKESIPLLPTSSKFSLWMKFWMALEAWWWLSLCQEADVPCSTLDVAVPHPSTWSSGFGLMMPCLEQGKEEQVVNGSFSKTASNGHDTSREAGGWQPMVVVQTKNCHRSAEMLNIWRSSRQLSGSKWSQEAEFAVWMAAIYYYLLVLASRIAGLAKGATKYRFGVGTLCGLNLHMNKIAVLKQKQNIPHSY